MSIFIQHRRLRASVHQALDSRHDETGNAADTRHSSQTDVEKEFPDPNDGVPGISIRYVDDDSKGSSKYYLVNFASPDDPLNPQNWSMLHKLKTTFILILIAFIVTAASAVDSAVLAVAARDYNVSEVAESLAGTGIFLIGFGLGALICSPLSELLGRYLVFLGALVLFGIWQMASALAPNVGAQSAFRFLSGLCGSAPLTVTGGSLSDIFNAKEKTWAFTLFALIGFGGPVLGPVMASYIPVTGVLSWHWADWIMVIGDGVVIAIIIAFKQETLATRILARKAAYFRQITGDQRFKTVAEAKGESTAQVLKVNFSRPFLMAVEPIIMACTLYLTIVYIVLFTFLDGYNYIFAETYNLNSGLSNIIFLGLFIGIVSQVITLPFIWRATKRQLERDGDPGDGSKINRESRLLFAMVGAPTVPIGLFWMAWTARASISIWSPIMASVLIGFGTVSIFISSYLYVIDSYRPLSASALTFVALVRYLAAGAMTVVGNPFYENLGVHYTLTILACISAAAAVIPYALYRYGPLIRAKSKYTTTQQS